MTTLSYSEARYRRRMRLPVAPYQPPPKKKVRPRKAQPIPFPPLVPGKPLRKGRWQVFLSTPGKRTRLVAGGLCEDDAREAVGKLNGTLPPARKTPFAFYFCEHRFSNRKAEGEDD